MASNENIIPDEDGDFSDWIELYNPGDAPVHLHGWGLSDRASDPFKWMFGDSSIAPNGYLLVWASGKNRVSPGSGLAPHTSFSINAEGEEIVLTRPDGTREDTLDPVAIPRNWSLGRQPDGASAWYFFEQPTPAAANTTPGIGALLPTPLFSVHGGLYNSPVTLEITSPVPQAEIRVTFDGSEPDPDAQLYSAPLRLESREGTPNNISEIPTNHADPHEPVYREGWEPPGGEVFKIHTIRARLVKPGYPPGPVATHSFLIDPKGTNRYTLPVISLCTDAVNLFDYHTGIYVPGCCDNFFRTGSDWERPGFIELFENDGTPALRGTIGIRLHGGTTRNRPRKSLRIIARDPSTFQYRLFPEKDLDTFDTFILRNGGNDWGDFIFRDLFMQSLVDQSTLDRQQARSAILFINGEYWGIHNIRERFDDAYFKHNYNLDEQEYVQMEDFYDAARAGTISVFERGNEDYADDYFALRDLIEHADITDASVFAEVCERMDVDNFIDYFASQIYFGNTDWPGNNVRLWRSAATNRAPDAPFRHDGKWRWILFDTDFGFGLPFIYVPGYGDNPYTHDTLAYASAEHPTDFSNDRHATMMFRRLIQNDTFRHRFIMRFCDLLNTAFAHDRVLDKFWELLHRVEREMPEHIARWRKPRDWHSEAWEVAWYGYLRPDAVRDHLRGKFNLSDAHPVRLDIDRDGGGSIRVNDATHPASYPWDGAYFEDYPVSFLAQPAPNHRFASWSIEEIPDLDQQDHSSNYETNWLNYSYGGDGYSSWYLESSHAGMAGHLLVEPEHPIAAQSADGRAFAIFAREGHWATASRSFLSPLAIGDSFSILLGMSAFSGNKGIVLSDYTGEDRFRFSAGTNATGQECYYYRVYPAAETPIGTPLPPLPDSTFLFTVTRLSQTNYAVQIEREADVFELDFSSPGELYGFRLYNSGTPANDDANRLLFNNLHIHRPGRPGIPDFSTNALLSLSLTNFLGFVARFEPLHEGPIFLLHYWNHNDETNVLDPSYTLGGAALESLPGPATEILAGTGQEFFGENARFGDEPGSHLRVNNPLEAALFYALPTTDYEAIRLRYETRRSNQGAGLQQIAYTLDGTNYLFFTNFLIHAAAPVLHTLDFSGVPGADDNAHFGIRIAFQQGAGGTGGNNRIDNFTVEGYAKGGANVPPVLENPVPFQELIEAGTPAAFDLNHVYRDPDGDPLTFTAHSDDPAVLAAAIQGGTLTLTPLKRGQATISLTASDGIHQPVPSTFRALVYPVAHTLADGPYTFSRWDSTEPAGHYPDHMIFLQDDRDDPGLTAPLHHAYHIPAGDAALPQDVLFPYAAESRTRINALGDEGISFINTGRERDLGGALLALDTRNVATVPVSWLAGTRTPNERIYAIRLQYRVGAQGPFTDLPDADSRPVEYVRNLIAGHAQPMPPVNLPHDALGQPYVQLLWRYYPVSGESGPRAELRLDDLTISHGAPHEATRLDFLIDAPAAWQSGKTYPPLAVRAINEAGLPDLAFSGPVTLAASGATLAGHLSVDAVSGVAYFTNVIPDGAGLAALTASTPSLEPATGQTNRLVRLTEIFLPAHIQGRQDPILGNNERLPFAYRLRLEGLRPDARYRFGNRVAQTNDLPQADNDAGNMIITPTNDAPFIRNTATPRFLPEDLNARHGELVTAPDGSCERWFITEPSGNERFTPGNQLVMRLILNDGNEGATPQLFLDTSNTVAVLSLGTGSTVGSAMMGYTNAPARSLLLLYDNTAGTGRPLAATPIEVTGAQTDDRYAGFYHYVVAQTPGYWGTIIPNNLPGGVRRIERRRLHDGGLINATSFPDGIPGTITASAGRTPICFALPSPVPPARLLSGGEACWNEPYSWSTAAIPSGTGAEAVITAPALTNRDVILTAPVVIGNLLIDNADSPHRNRLAGRPLTWHDPSGQTQLTVEGDGDGHIEFQLESGVFLQSDLVIDSRQIESSNNYGGLRLRETWSGPGGLIKQGPGHVSLTGTGKVYAGTTRIEQGVLAFSAPAASNLPGDIIVREGGQLRLSSSNDETGNRHYTFGGTIRLASQGRTGVPESEDLGVLGALRYEPGAGTNRAIVHTPIHIEGNSGLHINGLFNEMELAGPITGTANIKKSGGGLLILSGTNSPFSGHTTVETGTLRVEAHLNSHFTLGADSFLEGPGRVQNLMGTGTIAPNGSILAVRSLNGLNYRFSFSRTGDPVFSNPAESLNDLLRVEFVTPFLSQLNPDNRIDLFFDLPAFHSNDVFHGGFFTHRTNDFFASIRNARWTYHLQDDAGEVEHAGKQYRVYDGPLTFQVTNQTFAAPFNDGVVTGRIMRISFAEAAPPPPPESPFDDWRGNQFTPEELDDPSISGPEADPDESGIPNLMRFALGLDRNDPYDDALPRTGIRNKNPLLIYRRLTNPDSGIEYSFQTASSISPTSRWTAAQIGRDLIEIATNAITTEIEDILLGIPPEHLDQSPRFFHLQIRQVE